MRGRGGEVRVALATEHTEMLIGGLRAEESTMGSADGQRLGRQEVEDVGGCGQSFNPVGGWKAGLKQQGAHNVVSGPDDALGPPILG
jgi:hypothetical protein